MGRYRDFDWKWYHWLVLAFVLVCVIHGLSFLKGVAKSMSKEPIKISDISFWEVRRKFGGLSLPLSDVEKAREWSDYRGKWVRWTGEVENVLDEGRVVYVDMTNGLFAGKDVCLELTEDSAPEAMKLRKGDPITYLGRLSDRPGVIRSLSLTQVSILSQRRK